MARQIADNLIYKAPKPLDERTYFETFEAMGAYPEVYIPDGLRAFCKETNSTYIFNTKVASVDADDSHDYVGKWRKIHDKQTTTLTVMPHSSAVADNVYYVRSTVYDEALNNHDVILKNLSFDETLDFEYLRSETDVDPDGNECTYDIYRSFDSAKTVTGEDEDDELRNFSVLFYKFSSTESEVSYLGEMVKIHYLVRVEQETVKNAIIAVTTKEDLKDISEVKCFDGVLGYVKNENAYYNWYSERTETEELGKWLKIETGGGGEGLVEAHINWYSKSGTVAYDITETKDKDPVIDDLVEHPEKYYFIDDGITFNYDETIDGKTISTGPVDTQYHYYSGYKTTVSEFPSNASGSYHYTVERVSYGICTQLRKIKSQVGSMVLDYRRYVLVGKGFSK